LSKKLKSILLGGGPSVLFPYAMNSKVIIGQAEK